MTERRTMDSAPRDGRTVEVFWTDEDGEESLSPARYRSLERLRRAGGDWDEADEGWWIFIDSRTQKRVEPTAWVAGDES
jgi:hypothetical protein